MTKRKMRIALTITTMMTKPAKREPASRMNMAELPAKMMEKPAKRRVPLAAKLMHLLELQLGVLVLEYTYQHSNFLLRISNSTKNCSVIAWERRGAT